MELSVIVTHHHDIDHLRKCLRILEKELAGIDSEIVVVLSESRPGDAEALKKDFPAIRLFPFEENLYFVRLMNRGLREAKGDFILAINDDVFVSEGSVARLIEFLKNDKRVGLVGPRILYPDGGEQSSCFRFYTPLVVVCRRSALGKIRPLKKICDRFLYGDKDLTKTFDVDWLSNGAGSMTRRECFEKVGLLDEGFKHYFSDVDWCRRFWQNGYRVVYFPETFFYHHHGKRSGNGGVLSLFSNPMARIHLLDGIRYFLKWGVFKTPSKF